MHTFSPISTQYEIENWISPHPGVRRLQDARNPSPRRDPRHSLHPVIPQGRPSGEKEKRARLKSGKRRWHPNEHGIVYNDPNSGKEDTAKEKNLKTDSLKITTGRWKPSGQPQHHESMHDMPLQTVQTVRNSNSVSRNGNECVIPSELLSAVSSSHQPYKQPQKRSTQSAPLPLARHGSHATQIQLLLHPTTYSLQKSTAAHRSNPAQSEGPLRSLSCKSQAMEARSKPSRDTGESHITILGLFVTHNKSTFSIIHKAPRLGRLGTFS